MSMSDRLKRLFSWPRCGGFHEGGIVGLKPGEVPVVLSRGDERWLRPGEKWLPTTPPSQGGSGKKEPIVITINHMGAVDNEMAKLIAREMRRQHKSKS